MRPSDEELIAWNGEDFPPAIEAIRHRIDQLPRWQTIGVLQGWWPILVRLDERLRDVDPEYQLTQVKQKFGSLDVHVKKGPSPAFSPRRVERRGGRVAGGMRGMRPPRIIPQELPGLDWRLLRQAQKLRR